MIGRILCFFRFVGRPTTGPVNGERAPWHWRLTWRITPRQAWNLATCIHPTAWQRDELDRLVAGIQEASRERQV
jgi:hypothetical protein